MKIAVVGSKGLLGNALVRIWTEQGEEIVPLDLPDFDITTRMFVLDAFRSLGADVIVNAAGITKIDWLEKRPNTARTVHIQGTANLREAAQRSQALFVHFSCGEVFGEAAQKQDRPLTENDTPEPVSVYASTKLDSERAAAEYDRHLIVRTSTLFGKTGEHTFGNMVESLLRSLVRPEQMSVIDDTPTSPTWTDDLAQAVHFLIKKEETGIFHVANRGKATPYEISEEILRISGLKRKFQPISSENYGFLAPRAIHTVLKSKKYEQLEGNYPLKTWQESLTNYLSSRAVF